MNAMYCKFITMRLIFTVGFVKAQQSCYNELVLTQLTVPVQHKVDSAERQICKR